jgi:hypothetical protein
LVIDARRAHELAQALEPLPEGLGGSWDDVSFQRIGVEDGGRSFARTRFLVRGALDAAAFERVWTELVSVVRPVVAKLGAPMSIFT